MTIDEYVASLDVSEGSSDNNAFNKALQSVKESNCLMNCSAAILPALTAGNYSEAILRLQETLALTLMAGSKCN